MADSASTFTQQVMTCPACEGVVLATFTTRIELGKSIANAFVYEHGIESGPMTLDAKVTITGMELTHDCRKVTTR